MISHQEEINGKMLPTQLHPEGEPIVRSAASIPAREKHPVSPSKAILARSVRLPSPPAVAIRILQAFKNEDVTLGELVRIISSDPALSAKVLKVANSALYTRTHKVQTLKKAIAVLGLHTLKNISLSFVIMDGICSNSKTALNFESFWRKSITAAVSSQLMSAVFGTNDNDLFIGALLQDMGIVVLDIQYPKEYNGLHNMDSPALLLAGEREAFGIDHQEVGYEVLMEWGLPENICDLVRYHHSLDGAPEHLLTKLRVLHLANMLSTIFHTPDSAEDFESFSMSFRAIRQADNSEIEQVINSAYEKTKEIFSFFEIHPGNMKTCSQILQEANEELGRLNLSYEQMLMELRGAKEKAEKLARELVQANTKLRELAHRDALTGLFNHRYFQELLDREMNRASRYGRPFSLIMFDLDRFKRINDQYGHPTGDGVLKQVSDLTRNMVRKCDYVARYGGEEFAVILPETGSKGAVLLGERLRRTIEQTGIAVNGTMIHTTISIGVATYYPGRSETSRSHIISAADKALYVSKNNGRNKISVAST